MKVVRTAEIPITPSTSPLMMGGEVTMQRVPFEGNENLTWAIVNFGAGSRNKFHSHTTDQILVITSGIGAVATEGETIEVTDGDIIHIPAGEKHWHGARPVSYMSHITIMGGGAETTQLED